jgi:ASC-1-like (ASCH) protein
MRSREIETKNIIHFFANDLSQLLDSDPIWKDNLLKVISSRIALHLAVFREPYLTFLLEGKKTIESRFSLKRQAPYNQISEGDIILLKRASGPIVGLCQVEDAWFYKLDSRSWREIKNEYFKEIYVQDQSFWDERQFASYATLIRVQNTRLISPIKYPKRDRRGWVVLLPRESQLKMDSIVSTQIGG